jgi:S-adenosylmethionine synthetase
MKELQALHAFTSESVSEGHPDKVADQISDAILDAYLAQDKDAKVACECLITTGQCIIAGEITANAQVDVVAIASNVIKEIGYTHAEWGFDYANARYLNLLHEQSREINNSVVHGGAGDQGLMFGYACNETPELMPLPITLSHRLMERQALLRKEGVIPWLLPDAKAQVTVLYDEQQNPVTVTKVVLSTQHQKGVSQEQIRKKVIDEIVAPVICPFVQSNALEILINPSGSFTIGGPHGDTGLTGRKIIVDTYGGSCPHGGGAFSGKDPSKVDRSAAYMARFIAKHIVAAGLATRATVQLAYAIGVAEPVSVHVNLHGTGKVDEHQLAALISQKIDLTPSGIISRFKLKQTVYRPTASYGHFGRSIFSWEQLDEELLQSMRSKI